MSSTVVLATGQVTAADTLTIDLVVPPDAPAAVLIRWPGLGSPSVSPPGRFPAVALSIISIMDNAMIELQRMANQGGGAQPT